MTQQLAKLSNIFLNPAIAAHFCSFIIEIFWSGIRRAGEPGNGVSEFCPRTRPERFEIRLGSAKHDITGELLDGQVVRSTSRRLETRHEYNEEDLRYTCELIRLPEAKGVRYVQVM